MKTKMNVTDFVKTTLPALRLAFSEIPILEKHIDDNYELTNDKGDIIEFKIAGSDDGDNGDYITKDQLPRIIEDLMKKNSRSSPPFDVTIRDRVLDDPKWGFKSIADFGQAVKAANPQGGSQFKLDNRLKALPTNYNYESSGVDGGYLVPPEFRQEVWTVAFADEGILNLCDLSPTVGNSVTITTDETTPWGTTGVQAYWRSEAGQMTTSKAALKQMTVPLHDLYAFVPATDDLLQDGPRLQNILTVKAGQAIRYKADYAIVKGTGVGQPLGFLTSSAKVSQAKETSQTATTINATNVAKMYGRLLPGGQNRAVWLINPDAINQLLIMTVGQSPIWRPPLDITGSPKWGTLLGLPVIPCEHCATLGTVQDIILADLKGGYAAFNKANGIDFQSSIHLWFDYGLTAFRWTFRLGGQPYMSSYITPPNSSVTKAHFITLDTRS